MKARTICTLGAFVLAGLQPAFSQSRDVQQQIAELDRQCEAARDAILPAIIEWKIQDCVNNPPPRARLRTLEQCRTYWFDFGTIKRQREYLDIDVCKEAFRLRQQHRSRNR